MKRGKLSKGPYEQYRLLWRHNVCVCVYARANFVIEIWGNDKSYFVRLEKTNQPSIEQNRWTIDFFFRLSLIDWYPFACNNFLFRLIYLKWNMPRRNSNECTILWAQKFWRIRFLCAYVRLSRYRPCQSTVCHCTISKEFLWQKNYSFGQLYSGANRSKNLHM